MTQVYPKKGKASVGVARQYCGATGKIDNCQSVVTWHCSTGRQHFPVTAQLYLPESWTEDTIRMHKVGVPVRTQSFKEKWRIALELLDSINDPSIDTLLFDAGYGSNRVFLGELDKRQRHVIGQIRGTETFWSGEVELDESGTRPSGLGRHRKYPQVVHKQLQPKSAEQWAKALFADSEKERTCQLPLAKPKSVHYVSMRVYETLARPYRRVGTPRWLVIERLSDGSLKYYVSNYDAHGSPERILIKGHKRWEIEQGYQQLKEELGLDHYEGRSWQGLHHHITLCFMAYGFLQLLRCEQKNGTICRPCQKCGE